MASFLTTRQLQDILQVDRTTIYRMAEDGRLPAFKVGKQWRFPRQQIDQWLQTKSTAATDSAAETPMLTAVPTEVQPTKQADMGAASNSVTYSGQATSIDVRKLAAVECVQQIQDAFADLLEVTVVITDLDGQPITQPSNPCGLYSATESSPTAKQRCIELWARLAQETSLQPTFVESHIGLLCARGLIRVGNELRAMLVVGGIAPPKWPPKPEKISEIADYLELPAEVVERHLDEVFYVEPGDERRILGFVQRMADIVAQMMVERNELFTKLESIAALTRY